MLKQVPVIHIDSAGECRSLSVISCMLIPIKRYFPLICNAVWVRVEMASAAAVLYFSGVGGWRFGWNWRLEAVRPLLGGHCERSERVTENKSRYLTFISVWGNYSLSVWPCHTFRRALCFWKQSFYILELPSLEKKQQKKDAYGKHEFSLKKIWNNFLNPFSYT